MNREYVIEGSNFSTLEEFYAEVDRVLVTAPWGHNLDALNDILRGGFGTPDEGYVIRWRDSALSRYNLGHPETVRMLELMLTRCHPTNRERVSKELADAKKGIGQTTFELLIEIIQVHCPGGEEEEDGVELILE